MTVRKLPAFLAGLHELAQPPFSNDVDRRHAIASHLQRLAGFTAPVSVWLDDLLAARTGDGNDGELAEVIATEGLNWRGHGNERVQVGTLEELNLFSPRALPDADTLRLFTAFRDPSARYAYNQISDSAQQPAEILNQQWWQAVWGGWLATDDWTSLQQAARRKFQLTDVPSGTTVSTMRRRARGIANGWPGSWRLLQTPDTDNPMREFEEAKLRVRILLDRYGFVNRELVTREGQSWSTCFRALRVMELAGEVSGGLFFQGLSGPQFALPSTLHRLREPMSPTSVWWVNATDCASPCGLGLDWPELPQRRGTNYLAFIGEDLAVVVENGGKSLRFLISPDHPATDEALAVLVHIARRRRRIEVHSINDADAFDSPWLLPLDRVLRVQADHKRVELEVREATTTRR
jgi:ATP-dependent helicase Lhr and Lhr-like helicase